MIKKNLVKKLSAIALLSLIGLITHAQIGQKMKSQQGVSLAGTWLCNNGGQMLTLVLFGNSKGEFDGEEITYIQTDNKLTIKSAASSTTYTYKLSGSNLTLSGGDLDKPAVFSKPGGQSNEAPVTSKAPAVNKAAAKELLGSWVADGVEFTFKEGGILLYNDKTMEYTVEGKKLYCQNDEAGVNVTYDYEVSRQYLLLKYNGNTLTLQKKNGNSNTAKPGNTISGNKKPPFLGNWISTENEHLSLMEGGQMKLEGYDLNYTYDATTITVNTTSGSVVFQYKLKGNVLTCTANGKTSTYQKEGTTGNYGYSNNQQQAQGGIDQTMVGKWCIVNTSSGGYNTSGSYSSSECFVLEANGSYTYSSEGSRSVEAGSTASQGGDRGTWSVQGNTIIARSQNGSVNRYTFQKVNSDNGDPCLLINGTRFVTYYNKPSWR